jgi:hypothetical protein
MSGKPLRIVGKWLLAWGILKAAWDVIGHIGNVQTLWDMISGAVQYWPAGMRGLVWVATSWWFPLIASMGCLLFWRFLSKTPPQPSIVKPDSSRIRISCGKSVEKSVVSADGEMWYRARLDLESGEAIPDLEAIVTDLWEDEQKVRLQENLVLTMHPGMLAPYPTDRNMRTLTDGCPEFVDVIRVGPDRIAHFPLKFYPRAVDHAKLLTPQHAYKMTVAIRSPVHQTLICAFEFEWTGDTDTSDIRLLKH